MLILVLGDSAALLVAVTIAAALRFRALELGGDGIRGVPLMLGVFIGCYYVSDLYNFRTLGSRFVPTSYLSRYILGTLLAAASLALASYLWPEAKMGRGILVVSSLLMAGLGYWWRMLFRRVFIMSRPRMNVAVVGSVDELRVVEQELGADDFVIWGFIVGREKPESDGRRNDTAAENGVSALMQLVEEHEVDAVVVGTVEAGRAMLVKSLINAKLLGVEVHTPASMIEHFRGKVPIIGLTDDWMALTPFRGTSSGLYATHLKRVVDFILASLGMLAGLPLVALAAIAIKCDSRGPVFYRQTRVGLNGRDFKIIKLRSMRCDAERSGAVWAKKHDPRATRVGRLLRQFRIDELPQLWNVLAGDMSVIGPRPERPEFVRSLESEIPFYAIRHAVTPGITGWAQVSFRYGASSDDAREKLEYDLFYLKNQSLFLELVIVLKTIGVVIFGSGGVREVASRVRVGPKTPLRRRVNSYGQRVARTELGHAMEHRETQGPLR